MPEALTVTERWQRVATGTREEGKELNSLTTVTDFRSKYLLLNHCIFSHKFSNYPAAVKATSAAQ